MEPKGRRGPRAPVETAASERPPVPPSEEAAPEIMPPFAGEPAAPPPADDPGAPSGDSLTALAAAQEALARQPEAPVEPAAPRAADERYGLDRDSLTALARSQAALARGLIALGFEMAGLACSGFEVAARTATRLLAVRTPSEAARLQADYVRSSLGSALAGSARLSNLGVKIAAEATEPLVAQLGRNWVKAVRRAH